MKARWVVPVALAAAAAGSCAELSTDPQVAAAIEFEGIPYPAVITGDTLRNAAGIATPLTAVTYNGNGDVIADPVVQFVALDTGVTIDEDGFLVATRRDGTVELVASANGLQSVHRTIQVTRRPDTVFASSDTIRQFAYKLPDAASNVTTPLGVTVQSFDTAGGVSPNVAGWLVRWRLLHAGDTLAVSDSTLAVLTDEGTRRVTLDTTSASGVSSRRLRVFANNLTAAVDSFVVVAAVERYGVPLLGSPVRFVIHVMPETVP